MGVDTELVMEITRAADRTMAAAQEWKRKALAAEARVAELEGQLKGCAVHTRQELNLGSGDPADYAYTRHCSLCHRWSDESDDADELKPVVHAASCLLSDQHDNPACSKSVSSSTEEKT